LKKPFTSVLHPHVHSPNLQILATLDTRGGRWNSRLCAGEPFDPALDELRREINTHTVISKYFKALTPAEMIPQISPDCYADYAPGSWAKAIEALDHDESSSSHAHHAAVRARGLRRHGIKGILAAEHDIQINKTSRTACWSDQHQQHPQHLAHIIKALATWPGIAGVGERGNRRGRVRRAREIADGRRARPAELLQVP